MRNHLIALFLISILFSSCSISSRTARTAARQIDANESAIVQKPLIGDVEVDLSKKITATVTVPSAQAVAAKEQANQLALDQNNFDILIDPVYDINYSGANADVKVIGYGAKYTKIETASESDIQVLYEYNLKKIAKELSLSTNTSAVASANSDLFLFIVNDNNTKFKNRKTSEFKEASAANLNIYKSYKGLSPSSTLTKQQNLEFMWLLQYDIQNYKRVAAGKSPSKQSRDQYIESMKKGQKVATGILAVCGVVLVVILIGAAAG